MTIALLTFQGATNRGKRGYELSPAARGRLVYAWIVAGPAHRFFRNLEIGCEGKPAPAGNVQESEVLLDQRARDPRFDPVRRVGSPSFRSGGEVKACLVRPEWPRGDGRGLPAGFYHLDERTVVTLHAARA